MRGCSANTLDSSAADLHRLLSCSRLQPKLHQTALRVQAPGLPAKDCRASHPAPQKSIRAGGRLFKTAGSSRERSQLGCGSTDGQPTARNPRIQVCSYLITGHRTARQSKRRGPDLSAHGSFTGSQSQRQVMATPEVALVRCCLRSAAGVAVRAGWLRPTRDPREQGRGKEGVGVWGRGKLGPLVPPPPGLYHAMTCHCHQLFQNRAASNGCSLRSM